MAQYLKSHEISPYHIQSVQTLCQRNVVDEQLHRDMLVICNYWKIFPHVWWPQLLFPVREVWFFEVIMKLLVPETTVIIWAI